MTRRGKWLAGVAVGVGLASAALPGSAVAGPCTEQLGDVTRQLANSPASGGTTGAALAGNAPGAIQNKAPMPQQEPPSEAAETTGDGVKGEAVGTTMAGNAPGSTSQPIDPAAGKATSAQDVRLQQQGEPTMAQGGSLLQSDERTNQAKMALEEAQRLDQQGSNDCAAKLDEARKLISGS
jgi:hypothetical protein